MREEELASLKLDLQILKTQEAIRDVRHHLSQTPNTAADQSINSLISRSLLQLMKQADVDINSLPPAKPFVFSGDIIEFPTLQAMFDLLVESKDLYSSQKLVYLEPYLSCEALDSMKGLNALNTSEAYGEARQILRERFGDPDPYDTADDYREQLEKWPVKADTKGLRKYSDFLRQCVIAMQSISELSKLDDPRTKK